MRKQTTVAGALALAVAIAALWPRPAHADLGAVTAVSDSPGDGRKAQMDNGRRRVNGMANDIGPYDRSLEIWHAPGRAPLRLDRDTPFTPAPAPRPAAGRPDDRRPPGGRRAPRTRRA